jgi:hypothetical protein
MSNQEITFFRNMVESGLALTDLFQPYGGFPDGVGVASGYITMPQLAGIGFEGKSDLYREMKALTK